MHSNPTTRLSRIYLLVLGVAITLIFIVFLVINRSNTTLPSGEFENSPATDSIQSETNASREDIYPQPPSIPTPASNRIKRKQKEVDVIEHEIVIEDPTANLPSPPIKAPVAEPIYTIVEENATPKEGLPEFYNYINRKMKYPALAVRTGVEGRVFVEFIVEKDGTLTEVKSIKGIGAGCDEEAVRLISSSPPWKPAMLDGELVRQKVILHIRFELSKKQRRKD